MAAVLPSAATTNSANDYVNFEIDSSGNIQSKPTYDIDYDKGQTSFDMDVTYTHSDGAQAKLTDCILI